MGSIKAFHAIPPNENINHCLVSMFVLTWLKYVHMVKHEIGVKVDFWIKLQYNSSARCPLVPLAQRTTTYFMTLVFCSAGLITAVICRDKSTGSAGGCQAKLRTKLLMPLDWNQTREVVSRISYYWNRSNSVPSAVVLGWMAYCHIVSRTCSDKRRHTA